MCHGEGNKLITRHDWHVGFTDEIRGTAMTVHKLAGPLVTTARADLDLVITEFGIADMRGKTMDERAHALIDIASPEHRDRLLASWNE